ncbi:MAG: diaminobutyrate--2-oxoglutarate transaminase [Acidobacteriota bacterium]|nr:diaminobutyrate--2-oxoglutarate transaminase [Acidobacteriota bacterium]
MLQTIQRMESEVRGYCRSFPTVFSTARGSHLTDVDGKQYLDFFSGAGVLSYGHNHPLLKKRLLEYLESDGVTHSLDMATEAKVRFLERLDEVILGPRQLPYKVQFPGPTGTNAVESALKLARKVTGRERVLFFTNGFHGMTLGSLAVTGNASKRAGAGIPLANATPVPFDGYLGSEVDSLDFLETALEDSSSGFDKPAAVIIETVQAEGGVNVAGHEWLKRLAALLKRHGVLLIVDDIQVGCGRTGPFFSFEKAGIVPDIVCLSKALSGYGLPLAVVLMKPEHDIWEPGEHNGTFRGHNPAFVTATATLELWEGEGLTPQTEAKTKLVETQLREMAENHPDLVVDVRGRGLIQGVELVDDLAVRLSRECFQNGLIIETAGPSDEVLKLLPALTTPEAELKTGLDIISSGLDAVARAHAA